MIDKHFNTTFEIYRVSSSIDSNNFELESSVLLSTNKCYLEPLSGREVYVSDKYEARTTHRLFCSVIDVTEKDSIYIGSDIYNIDLVQNLRNNHLELTLILRK